MKKFALFIALALISVSSTAGNFYVGQEENIQNAIDAASYGDTIFIEGFHAENITVNKSIFIIGNGNCIINGTIYVDSDNVSIRNITVNRIIINASNCSVSYNFILNGGVICNGSNNVISHNFIENCSTGLYINGSNNVIFQNGFINNTYGIYCKGANNSIYHNNFIENVINGIDQGIENKWNLSSPREGNYWDDYGGSDSNSDGIGDMPYGINGSYDFYPLMNKYDIYPPNTTFTVALTSGKMGDNGWYIGNVSVTLAANDENNVAYINYRINNGEWQHYTNPINITSDGIWHIYFYSVDEYGNMERVKNATIKIDKTAPELYYSIFPPSPNGKNGWYNSSVELSLNAIDDNLDAIYYKIDNGTWQPYEGYPIIPDGTHKIYLKAVDYAGNFVIKNLSLKIDTHAPVVFVETPQNIVKHIYEIEYNASDNVDKSLDGNISIFYSWDNGNHWEKIADGLNNTGNYSWNTALCNDSAEAMLKIVAIDDAGNAGIATTGNFTLDNTPPHVNITSPRTGETFGKNTTIDINWEAYDSVDKNLDGSIYIYYWHENEWHYLVNATLNSGEYSIDTTGWEDGIYKIRVMAIDDAGNAGIATTGNFTIDKTPPSVYISKPLKGYMYINIFGREMLPPIPLPGLAYNAIIVGEIKVEIEASDAYSGIQEVKVFTDEINGVPVGKPYTWTWDPSFGAHYLKAVATDNAGNTNSYEIDNILCINV